MNKNIHIDAVDTFYQEYGNGKENIILLHGWGQSHVFWESAIKRLETNYHVYILDLPCFGISGEPSTNWNITAYADFLHKFISRLTIHNPIVLGHSFGGRIAIAYASEFPIKKLILYSTGGGLPEKSLKKMLYKYLFINIGKHIMPNVLYRSQTFIYKPKEYSNNIVIKKEKSRRMLDIYTQRSEDLRPQLGKIKARTLIITGVNDFISDPKTGEELQKRIKNSSLVAIKDATHFAHLEYAATFYSELNMFLSRP